MNYVTKLLTMPSTLILTGFNETAAKELFLKYAKPLWKILVWAVPIVCVLVCLFQIATWLPKDQQERNQQPIKNQIYDNIKWAIFAELIIVLLGLFGIDVSI